MVAVGELPWPWTLGSYRSLGLIFNYSYQADASKIKYTIYPLVRIPVSFKVLSIPF